MEWEKALPADPGHLFVKEMKMRSVSTSTPFAGSLNPCKAVQSLSVSAINNDSGLGASIDDGSCTALHNMSFDQSSDCDVTMTVCKITPYNRLPSVHKSEVNSMSKKLNASPVSSKCTQPFPSRRSLDSCLRTENHSAKSRTPFENHLIYGQTLSCVRRLDLDLDISTDATPATPDVSEIQLSKQFDEVLSKFSPPDPSQLIGRRMGSGGVDILGELWEKGFKVIVSSIMSLLEPKDLCRMCVVSQQWKSACESDTAADFRRKQFIKRQQRKLQEIGKENLGKRPGSSVSRGSQNLTGVLQALPTIQRQCDPPPGGSVAPSSTLDQFVQAAKCLKNDERLQKCPKCRKPARVLPVQDRGQCQSPDCCYDYCTKCLYSFHGSKDCVPIASKRQKTDCIGAKKSKKNLKRL